MQPSTLYNHKPKTVHTPCGRPILVIRASALRTSETERTGWVTPTSRDHKDSPGMVAQRDGKDRVDQLPRQAYLAGCACSPCNRRVLARQSSITPNTKRRIFPLPLPRLIPGVTLLYYLLHSDRNFGTYGTITAFYCVVCHAAYLIFSICSQT